MFAQIRRGAASPCWALAALALGACADDDGNGNGNTGGDGLTFEGTLGIVSLILPQSAGRAGLVRCRGWSQAAEMAFEEYQQGNGGCGATTSRWELRGKALLEDSGGRSSRRPTT